jgi:hypothetical protein
VAPATDGLRNITGRVNRDGTVTIWAVTSTVSGNGDQGADPNKLVAITDSPSASAPAAGEQFWTVKSAGFGDVLRGVSFTPGTFDEKQCASASGASMASGPVWQNADRLAVLVRLRAARLTGGRGQALSSSTPLSAATTPIPCTGRSRSARIPLASSAVTTG